MSVTGPDRTAPPTPRPAPPSTQKVTFAGVVKSEWIKYWTLRSSWIVLLSGVLALIAIAALVLLMFVAYRGFSVILFAAIAAMLAVLVTDPAAVPPVRTADGEAYARLVPHLLRVLAAHRPGAPRAAVAALMAPPAGYVAVACPVCGRGYQTLQQAPVAFSVMASTSAPSFLHAKRTC